MINNTGPDDDLPDIVPSPRLPTDLQDLTNRARTYVEAASSVNTRKAYAAEWKHFSAWCRRSNLSPLPRIRRSSDSILRPALPARPSSA